MSDAERVFGLLGTTTLINVEVHKEEDEDDDDEYVLSIFVSLQRTW